MSYDYWPYKRRSVIRKDLRVVAPPTSEPVSLELARKHLRIEPEGSPAVHEDDQLINDIYLPAAREACEQYLGAALAPQTLEFSLSRFPGHWHDRDIDLPFGPVHAIDSINYKLDGVITSFYDYNFASYGDRIRLIEGGSWPTADDYPDTVQIRYQTGYSLPDASPDYAPLPAALRAAILLSLSQIYDNCMQGTVCDITYLPPGCHYLLDPYVRKMGFA